MRIFLLSLIALCLLMLMPGACDQCDSGDNDDDDDDDDANDDDSDDGDADDDDDQAPDYDFDGPISRQVLENYLARALTMCALFKEGWELLPQHLRLIEYLRPKFVSHTVYLWSGESILDQWLANAASGIEQVHAIDPQIIIEAGIFEIVTTEVENLPIPDWVFEEFDLPVVTRNFIYEDMQRPDGELVDFHQPGSCVPDITQLETKLWFYYLARLYIDIGIECLHLGIIEFYSELDTDRSHLEDITGRIHNYGAQHARRHWILLEAHTHGVSKDGVSLLDFHTFPLRIAEVDGHPMEGTLEVGYYGDSIYGLSRGGRSPSGWDAESLPYMVEFDIWSASGQEGQQIGHPWIWGYDELSWFANIEKDERDAFLRFAHDWVRETDPNGYLAMPGRRMIFVPPENGSDTYYAHTKSDTMPLGFDQEETIKSIWDGLK